MARNALGKVGRKRQRAIAEDVRAVFNAQNLDRVRELKSEDVERWKHPRPMIAEWLETLVENGPARFAFSEPHWRCRLQQNGLVRVN